jgi:iron complex outermembrane recepter protein
MHNPGLRFRAYALASSAIVAAAYAGAAQAQVRPFNLPAQPAEQGIPAFARQAGVQVLADARVVRGKRTQALRNNYTVDQALDRLLDGTGLEAEGNATDGLIQIRAGGAKVRPISYVTVGAAQAAAPMPAGPPAAGEGAGDQSGDIVVTGSRIIRSGATTSTPTVMLGSADIAQAGAISPGDLLRQLPAVAPGLNSESSGVSFNGAGLDLIDLRSLGTNRTLVLVNGRRQVSSNPSTASVDMNTIPTPMIERVEVITGGASAVYGADAVSGVVNVILKQDFDGFAVNGQFGISSRGDGERYSIGAMAGSNFGDGRGNITAYVGYTKEEGVAYDARPGGRSGRNWISNPANTGPNDGIPDYVIADNIRQLGGQRESAFVLNQGGAYQAYGFNADGSVRPFGVGPIGLVQGGQFTDGGEAEIGYDSQCPQARCALRIPVERVLISTSGHYELADYADVFFEGRFAGTNSQARFGSVFEIPPATNSISINNPYVTDSVRALMQQAGVSSIGILRSDQELGPRGQDTDRRLYQLVAGSRGDIGVGNFKYEASFQYGSMHFTNTRLNDKYEQRWRDAVNPILDTDGVIKCATAEARAAGCVPINLMLPGAALTAEQLAYVRIPYHTETADLTQLVAGANVTGELGDFWGAGPIQVAFGAEYRDEKSDYIVSPIDEQGQGFYFTKRTSVKGGFDVKEAYAEIVVPLLKDLPFAKLAEFEGAIRASDYSTSGSTTSWKLGLTWAPVSDIRFRGVLARAVRAPNVGELYSPGSEGFITVDDPCDRDFISGGTSSRGGNCAAIGVPAGYVSNARTINIRTSTSGNPDLDVESADTLTLGAVLAPRFIPGLTVTADYFKIKIKNAINTFAAQDILNNCVDLTSVDNPFCASITRDANGDIQQIRRQNINVSRLNREGLDLEARYALNLEQAGSLNFGLLATRMFKVNTIVAPGTITGGSSIDQNGEFGYPKWKGRFTTMYNLDAFSLTGTLTYLSNMVRDVQPTQPEDNRASAGTGDFFLFNMQAGYDITPDIRFYVGADNVFDRLPPSLPDTRLGGAGSSDGASIFPTMGRYFYTGFNVKF